MKKFQVPEITSKTISPNTLKIYKSKLNFLSAVGIDTRDKLLENQELVCKIIHELQSSNSEARVYFSACFYVLADNPNTDKVTLYNAFQNYKDPRPEK